jgi:hypothetical protein
MAQDNEYVQKLIAARDREVTHRCDIADALAEKHNRGDTENMREASAMQTVAQGSLQGELVIAPRRRRHARPVGLAPVSPSGKT